MASSCKLCVFFAVMYVALVMFLMVISGYVWCMCDVFMVTYGYVRCICDVLGDLW